MILLNADASALCLRPDPELVRVFGIPPRRCSVESCPRATADGVSVAPRRPAAAPAGESRKHFRVRDMAPTKDPKSCHREELELLG